MLRGLQDAEINAWTEFCAHTFRQKKPHPPPASYFSRHFYNDPDRDAALVRVAFHDGKIVASCRVFRRQIQWIGSSETADDGDNRLVVAAGGVGEVCTAEEHRRRGLSAELLRDAMQCMKAAGFQLSLLHSAPAFFPVYEKAGYFGTTSHWSEVTIEKDTLLQNEQKGRGNSADLHVRPVDFPQDTKQLMAIHKFYSEDRFMGCIVRSQAYWEDYLAVELLGSLWVLVESKTDSPDTILGWMSLRERGERYQLREFGCKSIDLVPTVFRTLLVHHIPFDSAQDDTIPEATSSSVTAPHQTVRLHMPTAILCDLRQNSSDDSELPRCIGIDISGIAIDNDNGWMYKSLNNIEETSMTMHSEASSRPHLIWPSDSF